MLAVAEISVLACIQSPHTLQLARGSLNTFRYAMTAYTLNSCSDRPPGNPHMPIDDPQPRATRLVSLDFYRGLALIFVLIDHIDLYVNNVDLFQNCTPIAWGYCDASEIFLFISGFTFGCIYFRRLETKGFSATFRKVLGRAFQIWLSYQLVALLITLLAYSTDSPTLLRAIRLRGVDLSFMLIVDSLTLQYQPYCLQILAFYTIIFPIMLLQLQAARKWGWLTWIFPILLYGLVQIFPKINLPTSSSSSGWFFNPFAWQLLFSLAMFCGCWYAKKKRLPTAITNAALIISSGMIILAAWDKAWLDQNIAFLIDRHFFPEQTVEFSWALSKTKLGILRLLHICSLAIVVASATPILKRYFAIWLEVLTRPVILCGQNALFSYSIGVLLTYVGLWLIEMMGASFVSLLFVGVDAVVIMIAGCYKLPKVRIQTRPLHDS